MTEEAAPYRTAPLPGGQSRVTRKMRALLRAWATDDDAPPEVYLDKRNALAVLSALDAADALREALAAVEWAVDRDDEEYCPWCQALKPRHLDTCVRALALARYGVAVEPRATQ